MEEITDSVKHGYRLAFQKLRSLVNREYHLQLLNAPGARKDIGPDMDSPLFREVYDSCRSYTMTTIERIYALHESVRYLVRCKIPGDLVECGVWKGGSVMVICKTLVALNQDNRDVFLYDTFEGMSKPTERDAHVSDGSSPMPTWKKISEGGHSDWAYSSLNEVKKNVISTGYNPDRIRFVEGKVEDTIPGITPDKISLLRLDTDWYESTRHEMKHLFPRLVVGGVLILDDYGYFTGVRDAVDEYFTQNDVQILLTRIDHSCRIGVRIC